MWKWLAEKLKPYITKSIFSSAFKQNALILDPNKRYIMFLSPDLDTDELGDLVADMRSSGVDLIIVQAEWVKMLEI